jgi:hypothetical protein
MNLGPRKIVSKRPVIEAKIILVEKYMKAEGILRCKVEVK